LIQGSWWASKLGQHQVHPFKVLEASGQGIPKKVNLGDMPFWTHFPQIANRNKPETAGVAVFKQKTKKNCKTKIKKNIHWKKVEFWQASNGFFGAPRWRPWKDAAFSRHWCAGQFTMAVFCCFLNPRKEGGSLLAMS